MRNLSSRLLQRRSSSSSIHSFNQAEIKEKLQAFPGGSIDLLKQESGIGVLTINNPSRMNAFSGTILRLKNVLPPITSQLIALICDSQAA